MLLPSVNATCAVVLCGADLSVSFAQVDNLSYQFGLSEHAKERVDTAGHVELTHTQARKLSRTKVLCVMVTVVAVVFLVKNRSQWQCIGGSCAMALLFKLSELASMRDTSAKAIAIFIATACACQLASFLFFAWIVDFVLASSSL